MNWESASSSASISSGPAHRRSGVLRTTANQQDIARQRSQALLASVIRGEVSLDAILAFPIDWSSIAFEADMLRHVDAQRSEDEEQLPTMNPLAIKRRETWPGGKKSTTRRQRKVVDEQPAPSSLSLGLDLGQPSTSTWEAEAAAQSPASSYSSSASLPPSLCSSPRSIASSDATLCEDISTPKHQLLSLGQEDDYEDMQKGAQEFDYDLTLPSSTAASPSSLAQAQETAATPSLFASAKDVDPLDEMFDFAPSVSTPYASREANDWMVWPTSASTTVF